jgi:hypothetical protein
MSKAVHINNNTNQAQEDAILRPITDNGVDLGFRVETWLAHHVLTLIPNPPPNISNLFSLGVYIETDYRTHWKQPSAPTGRFSVLPWGKEWDREGIG